MERTQEELLARLKILMGDDGIPVRTKKPRIPAPKSNDEATNQDLVVKHDLAKIAIATEKPRGLSGFEKAIQVVDDVGEVDKNIFHPADHAVVSFKRCQLADIPEGFCSAQEISKFPYKYMEKELEESVSQGFYTQGKFWARKWDLFYIYAPAAISDKPLILFPYPQVLAFFAHISEAVGVDIHLPAKCEGTGLLLKFPDPNVPRPRFLIQISSRIGYDTEKMNVPSAGADLPGDPKMVKGGEAYQAFAKMMEESFKLLKNKNQKGKMKKIDDRVGRQKGWNRQVKRVQRYLGLRPTFDNTVPYAGAVLDKLQMLALNYEESKSHNRYYKPVDALTYDVEKADAHPFDKSVVFISVDVESYELNHALVTEIGISTLDTRDLEGLAPGENAINWMSKIRARHFRIKEYAHLRNEKYVEGCPDKFQFGKSEMISIKYAPKAIADCFRYPFSGNDEAKYAPPKDAEGRPTLRNVVLVGHDAGADIGYLQKMGYDPFNLSNLVEVVDTANMFRILTREGSPRSLGYLCYQLGITGWDLHNAGNDAYYTLKSMICIALRDLKARAEYQALDKSNRDLQHALDLQRRVQEATDVAEQRAMEDALGWSTEGEGSDGGQPAKLVRTASKNSYVSSARPGEWRASK
ncbi:MAG: hypothetical protein M1829_001043 [Trizodia sp. TS-e1964]|nr:MAG: hypothetical protein M1829_001043 [Trizodia sp. TS-e1964]